MKRGGELVIATNTFVCCLFLSPGQAGEAEELGLNSWTTNPNQALVITEVLWMKVKVNMMSSKKVAIDLFLACSVKQFLYSVRCSLLHPA